MSLFDGTAAGVENIKQMWRTLANLIKQLIGDVDLTKGDLQTQITNNNKDVTRSNTTSTAKPSHGGTFQAVKSITSDSKGRVTGVDTETVTLPAQYSHPTTSGNKHIPSGGSSGKILRWSSDGTAAWGEDKDTTYSNFVKSGSGAKAGLVPAPSTTAGTSKYLREDGTWQTPPDTNTTYSNFVKSGSGAKAGLVPAPSTTAGTSKYLREDGTWQTPPDTNTWRGIQNNLTSGSTSESLAAAQGKVLKGLIDEVKSLRATLNAYGLVKVTDSSAVTDSSGLALAATEKNASITGTLANQISQLNTELLTKLYTVHIPKTLMFLSRDIVEC